MIESSTRAVGSPAFPETRMFRAHAELCNAPAIANLVKPPSSAPGYPPTRVVWGAPGVARAQAWRRSRPSAVIDATSPMCWDETETAAALAFEEAIGLR
jgi:hypothetical protein